MKYPVLKFRYASPLDRTLRHYVESLHSGRYPSIEEVRDVVPKWKDAWSEINVKDKAWASLKEVIGSVPTDHNLYVYVVGGGVGALSHPFVVSTIKKNGEAFSKEKMQEVLLHELCHICLMDAYGPKNIYWPAYEERYRQEKISVFNHILIFAFLKKIFDILNLGEDRKNQLLEHPNSDYQRAIDLMLEHGADELLQEYRSNI